MYGFASEARYSMELMQSDADPYWIEAAGLPGRER